MEPIPAKRNPQKSCAELYSLRNRRQPLFYASARKAQQARRALFSEIWAEIIADGR